MPAYCIIELVLDVWFQWTILSAHQYLVSLHWVAAFASVGMLVSHWIYLVAAGLELFVPEDKDHQTQDTMRRNSSWNQEIAC
eukprot:CAMPEP_0118720086 /NCGR_PEP_ID=MMETSP0800-20121206/29900_1 /TAXON_ID=210618 ORGANISM="Striatella unipunctata, Strain CCMP2910" /NCGR_SAMPLE_ID=MMETSP0800 /ASSEMBLY_ACC=CAM_ASM_000638 /LENGTH=81 /DNA_ID=CAMNT_0006627657 /DNA_START=424 /DNA_END=669 /DNA_ORIENTATION=+